MKSSFETLALALIAAGCAAGDVGDDEPREHTTQHLGDGFLSYPLDEFYHGVTCDWDCYYTAAGSPHSALDFSTGSGKKVVRAAAAGQLTVHGWVGGCGNMATVDLTNGFRLQYCHFTSFTRHSGPIARGEQIGISGSTGYTEPPGFDHVHFVVTDPTGKRVSPGCPPGVGGSCNDVPYKSLWITTGNRVLKASEPLTRVGVDFDGDGCADLLGRRKSDQSLRLYGGNCAGGYLSENVPIGQSWGDFDHLFAVDFNGDGCIDVLGRRASDSSLRSYAGNCAGGYLSENVKIGDNWGDFDWLGAGDFDGDGCADVLGRRQSDRSLRLYAGNCQGGWGVTNLKIGHEWGDFDALLVTDFDANGCPDVIGRRASDRSLRLFAGNCQSGWGATNVKIGHEWGDFDALLARDFDGDGCADVIGRRQSDRSLRLYSGNCQGGWGATNVKIGHEWGDFDRLF